MTTKLHSESEFIIHPITLIAYYKVEILDNIIKINSILFSTLIK